MALYPQTAVSWIQSGEEKFSQKTERALNNLPNYLLFVEGKVAQYKNTHKINGSDGCFG